MDLSGPFMTADLKWTRERLRNFGRWSRSGGGASAGRTGSLEGRYLPPKLTEEDELERRRAKTEIDELDALKVYRALLPIYGFPRVSSFVLAGVYVWRLRGESLRAYLRRPPLKLSVRGRDLDGMILEAELAAHNRLARLDRREWSNL